MEGFFGTVSSIYNIYYVRRGNISFSCNYFFYFLIKVGLYHININIYFRQNLYSFWRTPSFSNDFLGDINPIYFILILTLFPIILQWYEDEIEDTINLFFLNEKRDPDLPSEPVLIFKPGLYFIKFKHFACLFLVNFIFLYFILSLCLSFFVLYFYLLTHCFDRSYLFVFSFYLFYVLPCHFRFSFLLEPS